jgi:adenine-specific DNA methylase
VTDPPYAGNVNYSELSDFYYVWLKSGLKNAPEFAPELGPKAAEIIVNPTRGQSITHFEEGLTEVFRRAGKALVDGGLMAFTFHHAEGKTWIALLRSLMNAGFQVEAVYPIQGDSGTALPMMEGTNITYDLIHVCRKRDFADTAKPRPWASIRQETRRRARAEIAAIEAGRYGSEPLSPNDVNIILIGKCLELYSRHYGAVIDHEGKNVPLNEALKQIRDVADQMVERERPLPSELDDIDPESRIYLRALCLVKEVKSDDVHKATRGVLEPADLIEAGLITKMRAGRGRSYEVKQPGERLAKLLERFGGMAASTQGSLFSDYLPSRYAGALFVDRIHLLLGLAEAGENLVPWLDSFRAETPQIRAALEYIEGHSKHLAAACRRVLSLLEVGPLLKGAI